MLHWYLLHSFSVCLVSWSSLLGHQTSSRASVRRREEGRLFLLCISRILGLSSGEIKPLNTVMSLYLELSLSPCQSYCSDHNTGISGKNKQQDFHKYSWGFFSEWNKLHRDMHQPGSWLRLRRRQRASKPHFPLLTSTAMAATALTYLPFYLQKSVSALYLSCSESCISLSVFCTSVNLASNGSVWHSSYIASPF